MLLHPQDATLTRYAAGSAGESVRRRVANHLADCPRCRTVVQSTRDLRAELVNGGVPDAPSALFARIVESRASGARVLLPVEAPGVMAQQVEVRRVSGGGFRAPRPIFWVALGGVAAVALAQVGTSSLDSFLVRREIGNRPAYVSPVRKRVSPLIPPAGPMIASRLREVALRYGQVTYGRGGTPIDSRPSTEYKFVRSSAAGSDWILISSDVRDGRGPDSIWISALTLEPTKWREKGTSRGNEVSYVRTYSLKGHQLTTSTDFIVPEGVRFTPKQVDGIFTSLGDRDKTYIIPDQGLPLSLTQAQYIASMMAIPLDKGWRGGFSSFWVWGGKVQLSPRSGTEVTGSHTVITPAGVFDCWEAVRVEYGQERVQWFRKSDGLFVGESAGEAGRHNRVKTVLLSEE